MEALRQQLVTGGETEEQGRGRDRTPRHVEAPHAGPESLPWDRLFESVLGDRTKDETLAQTVAATLLAATGEGVGAELMLREAESAVAASREAESVELMLHEAESAVAASRDPLAMEGKEEGEEGARAGMVLPEAGASAAAAVVAAAGPPLMTEGEEVREKRAGTMLSEAEAAAAVAEAVAAAPPLMTEGSKAYVCSSRFIEPVRHPEVRGRGRVQTLLFSFSFSPSLHRPRHAQCGLYGTRCQTVLAVWSDGRAELQERALDAATMQWGSVKHVFTVLPLCTARSTASASQGKEVCR